MSVFALNLKEQRSLDEEARLNPLDASQITPTTFTGTGKGIGMGVMRGGARVGQFVGLAGAVVPMAIDKITEGDNFSGKSLTDRYFGGLDETVNSAVDYWTPDYAEVGKAGRVLGGLAEIVLPMAAGAGNPVATATMVAGSQTAGTGTDLVRQGVDSKTAGTVAAVQGISAYAGFKIPFLGNSLASRIGSGASGNVLINAGGAAVQSKVLQGAGYDEQAKQFDPLNAEARAIDILTGVVFGGFAHWAAGRGKPITPSDADAVLTASNAKHFQQDTAPGIPADAKASSAHQSALEQAIEQLVRGELVSVPDGIYDAEFVRPVPPSAEMLAAMPRAKALSELDRQIETRLADKIAKDYPAAVAEYNALPDAQGGKVLNVDTARELSPDYATSKESRALLSPAVHEPASFFIKQLYAERLAEMPPDSTVMFTSGGTGAGKSTAINDVESVRAAMDRSALVYDTNMNGLKSAQQKIEQALTAGAKVEIVHVQRDPVDALVNGSLPRAKRIGRTVPLEAHEATHIGVAETIVKLAEIYKDDPRVSIRVIDNTRGRNQANEAGIEFVNGFDYNNLRGRLISAIQREYQDGQITDAVYRGTLGSAGGSDSAASGVVRGSTAAGVPDGLPPRQRSRDSDADGSRGKERLPGARPATREENPRQGLNGDRFPVQGKTTAAVTERGTTDQTQFVAVEAARQVMDASPDMPVALDDGTEVSVREAMARLDDDARQAATDVKAFQAAVTCYLRNL